MVCVWAPNLHEEMDSRMTTVTRRNPADKAKIDPIERACQVVCVWGSVHNINLGSTLHLSMSEASSVSGRGFEGLGLRLSIPNQENLETSVHKIF